MNITSLNYTEAFGTKRAFSCRIEIHQTISAVNPLALGFHHLIVVAFSADFRVTYIYFKGPVDNLARIKA